MKLETLKFGALEVAAEEIIAFPEGLLGFPGEKQFIILQSLDIEPFLWLQSATDPALAFVIIDPLLVYPHYKVEVRPEEVTCLELEDPGRARILAICVVPSDPQKATVNLKGPLVMNLEKRLGKQVISADPEHEVRHPLWPLLAGQGKEA